MKIIICGYLCVFVAVIFGREFPVAAKWFVAKMIFPCLLGPFIVLLTEKTWVTFLMFLVGSFVVLGLVWIGFRFPSFRSLGWICAAIAWIAFGCLPYIVYI